MPTIPYIELAQLDCSLFGALMLLCALYLYCLENRDVISRFEISLGLISLHESRLEILAANETEMEARVESAVLPDWPTEWPAEDEPQEISAAELVQTAKIQFVQSFAFRAKDASRLQLKRG